MHRRIRNNIFVLGEELDLLENRAGKVLVVLVQEKNLSHDVHCRIERHRPEFRLDFFEIFLGDLEVILKDDRATSVLGGLGTIVEHLASCDIDLDDVLAIWSYLVQMFIKPLTPPLPLLLSRYSPSAYFLSEGYALPLPLP